MGRFILDSINTVVNPMDDYQVGGSVELVVVYMFLSTCWMVIYLNPLLQLGGGRYTALRGRSWMLCKNVIFMMRPVFTHSSPPLYHLSPKGSLHLYQVSKNGLHGNCASCPIQSISMWTCQRSSKNEPEVRRSEVTEVSGDQSNLFTVNRIQHSPLNLLSSFWWFFFWVGWGLK